MGQIKLGKLTGDSSFVSFTSHSQYLVNSSEESWAFEWHCKYYPLTFVNKDLVILIPRIEIFLLRVVVGLSISPTGLDYLYLISFD